MAGENIQPIELQESNAWWPRLRSIFLNKFTDTLSEVRGVGVGYDLNPILTPGYRYAEQRNSVAVGLYTQGNRGHQAAIPTPQALIKQITGVGDTTQGR
jgi:hypothetical protein